MKLETKYGTLEMNILPTGEIKITSDIPFYKVEKTFDNTKEAIEFFNKCKSEIEKIITEMEEKKKTIESKSLKLYNELMDLVDKGFKKILLYGPTGTGKTFTLISVLKSLKESQKINDFIIITFSSGMEDIDLLGKFMPDEKKTIKYKPSELVEFLSKNQNKKIAIVFDEFNRASSKTLNLLVPMLDERYGKVILENFINNDRIEIPSENVLFFFTANFGAGYSGTFKLDDAILNRVEVALFVDYQEDLENNIISTLPEEKQELVKKIRNYLREAYKEGIINPYSTRDLKITVKLIEPLSSLDPNTVYNALLPVIYKLIKVDPQGYPDTEFLEEFKKFLKENL